MVYLSDKVKMRQAQRDAIYLYRNRIPLAYSRIFARNLYKLQIKYITILFNIIILHKKVLRRISVIKESIIKHYIFFTEGKIDNDLAIFSLITTRVITLL